MNALRYTTAGVLALFAAGLLVSGYLRFLYLGTADPPSLASFATELYIAITVFTAVILRRLGAPVRRLGFHATPGPAAMAHGSSNSIGIVALYLSG